MLKSSIIVMPPDIELNRLTEVVIVDKRIDESSGSVDSIPATSSYGRITIPS